jgi:molybdopterin converting factor small subunit
MNAEKRATTMRVHIPTPLRQYTAKSAAVDVNGATVRDALSNLISQHGELRRHLFTDEGKLRSFVNIYVNDNDIRYLQNESTPVTEGDTLSIVPSIAGGKS